MFGWFKKQDGFEWRNYVRTTILVRREQRRRKIDDARAAAVDGLKDAGRKGAEIGASGLDAAGRSVRTAGRGLWGFIVAAFAGFARQVATATSAAWRGLRAQASRITLPEIALPQFDGLKRALGRISIPLPRIPALTTLRDRLSDIPPRTALTGGAIAGLTALLAIGAWLTPAANKGTPARGTVSAAVAVGGGSAQRLEGRAMVKSGDTLRIDGATVRLSGIEAPDREQTCQRVGNSRPWPCGRAAAEALSRLVKNKDVVCDLGRTDVSGAQLATCRAGDADLADTLVRNGHAFAETGLFATYSSAESAARNAKAGVWSGEIERPSAFRAKRWEEAKRIAPEGCPIKGQVASGERVYVLPWSPSYERIRIRAHRGERWFCSEKEALDAGWKPVERS